MTSMRELPEDDEFAGVGFSQVDEDGNVLEVKTSTYALMSFWKGIGNADTIDISEDSNQAELYLELDLDLDDDEIDTSCPVWVNVHEPSSLIRFCAYPAALSNLSDDQIQRLYPLVAKVNGMLNFGSLEVFFGEDETAYVRYKATISTDGVRVGKVQMVDVLFANSRDAIEGGLNQLITFLHG